MLDIFSPYILSLFVFRASANLSLAEGHAGASWVCCRACSEQASVVRTLDAESRGGRFSMFCGKKALPTSNKAHQRREKGNARMLVENMSPATNDNYMPLNLIAWHMCSHNPSYISSSEMVPSPLLDVSREFAVCPFPRTTFPLRSWSPHLGDPITI